MLGHNVAGAQHAYTLILSSTQMQEFLCLQIIHYNKETYKHEGNHYGFHEDVSLNVGLNLAYIFTQNCSG